MLCKINDGVYINTEFICSIVVKNKLPEKGYDSLYPCKLGISLNMSNGQVFDLGTNIIRRIDTDEKRNSAVENVNNELKYLLRKLKLENTLTENG